MSIYCLLSEPYGPNNHTIENIGFSLFNILLEKPRDITPTEFDRYSISITFVDNGTKYERVENYEDKEWTNITVKNLISGAYYDLTACTVSGNIKSDNYQIGIINTGRYNKLM